LSPPQLFFYVNHSKKMIKNLIFTFGLTVCILKIVSYTNWNLILWLSIKKIFSENAKIIQKF